MMIRPADASDRDWIACTLAQRWGSTTIVTRGRLCDAASFAGLVAMDTTFEQEPERVGLLTYRLAPEGLEVVTIDALKTGIGIGTALLSNGVRIARNAGVGRVWLITTNDNLSAIRFYERKGFRVVAVHEGAVDLARLLKPSIPLVAENGIELHDELELELTLDTDA
jgi:ribosomal protein S18 acetylase RimI-like enzyme